MEQRRLGVQSAELSAPPNHETTPPSSLPLEEISQLKATPWNRGTASASEHLLGVQVDDAIDGVYADIKDFEPIEFEKMLSALLSLSRADGHEEEITLQPFITAVLPLCNDAASPSPSIDPRAEDIRKMRTHLDGYCNISSGETSRYVPLTAFLNRALRCLANIEIQDDPLFPIGEGRNLMFHVNDPYVIKGDHFNGEMKMKSSNRKPDLIMTSLEAVRRLQKDANIEWDQYALCDDPNSLTPSAVTPRDWRFPWPDAEVSVEVKLKRAVERPKWTLYDPKAALEVHPPQRVERCFDKQSASMPKSSRASLHSRGSRLSQGSSAGRPVAGKGRSATVSRVALRKIHSHTSTQLSTQHSKTLGPEVQPDEGDIKSTGAGSKRGTTDSSDLRGSKRARTEDDPAPRRLTPPVQTAMYAAERLSHAEWMGHAINLIMIDNIVRVWWYDRQGVFQSYGLNFVQNLPHFFILLLALQRMQGKLGVVREIWSDGGDPILSFPTAGDSLDLRLEGHEYLRTHYGIIGRGTWVRPAKSTSKDPRDNRQTLDGRELVVKFSWPEKARISEAEIIKQASQVDSTHVRGHIPKLVHSVDLETLPILFRRSLGRDAGHGERVLRVSVFERLKRLTRLEDDLFWKAFWDCFRCHLYLWKSGIEHRDISVSNLMYDPVTGDGVLNDFDLSRLRSPDHPLPTGSERTGTMPFIALELLSDASIAGEVAHIYRHDCESFAWVLQWICCRFKDGLEIDNPPFAAFEVADYRQCLLAKTNGENFRGRVWPTASFSREKAAVAMLMSKFWRHRYLINDMASEDDEFEQRVQGLGAADINGTLAQRDETDEELLQQLDALLQANRAPTNPTLMSVMRDLEAVASGPTV